MTGSNRSQSFTTTSSNDRWTGGRGNDIAAYNATVNTGDHDVLDGGSGSDTLVLHLTRAQWFNRALQNDIARFLRGTSGCNNNGVFEFSAFDLDVKSFEAIRIFVDGVELSGSDDRVETRDDRFSLTGNGSVAGNVLVNDRVADLARNVEVTSGPSAGALTFNADGTFTYSAGSAFDWLASGQTTTVSFTYRVTDADGDHDTATVTLTINGSNDGPVITGGVVAGTINEVADNSPGENAVTHMASGQITFTDADLSDTHIVSFLPQAGGYLGTFTVSFAHVSDVHDDDDDDHDGHHHQNGQGHHSHGNGQGNGHGSENGDECNDDDRDGHQHQIGRGHREHGNGNGYGHNEHDGGACAGRGTLTWTFQVADSAIDFLAAGETRTQVYTLTIDDGHGGTVQQLVTITLVGSADGSVNVAPETLPVTAIGNEDATIAVVLAGTDADGFVASFRITSLPGDATLYRDAALTQALAVGDLVTASANSATVYARPAVNFNGSLGFQYAAIDNASTADVTSASALVTVAAVNDAAAIAGLAAGSILEEATTVLGGTLTIADPDAGDAAFQAVAAAALNGTYGTFTFDAATGAWTYALDNSRTTVQALAADQVVHDTLTVISRDHTATQVIDMTIRGTNDSALLSSADVTLDETNAALSTSGTLSISDADNAAQFIAQSNVAGASGLFAIDTSGHWTYTANSAFDGLNVGQSVSDQFTVVAVDGTTTSVKVTIRGTNDEARIDPVGITLRQTDHPVSISYNLTISDVDSATTFRPATIVGAYGALTIAADGHFDYIAHQTNQGLQGTEFLREQFVVTAFDGTQGFVDIAIQGRDDAAVIGTPSVPDMTEDQNVSGTGQLLATGQIPIIDLDHDQSAFRTEVVAAADNIGTLVLATDGSYTYSVANSAVQYLGAGDIKVETFTVTGVDGTTKVVGFTINGANDGPVIAPIAAGQTNEDAAPFAIDLVQGATDTDGDSVTVAAIGSVVSSNAGRTVAYTRVGNTLVIDPAQFNDMRGGFNPSFPPTETITVTYTLTDGTATVTSTATLVVEGRNDAPVATPFVSAALYEGGWSPSTFDFNPSHYDFSLAAHVSEPDVGDSLSIVGLSPGSAAGPVFGTNGNGLYGQLTSVTPSLNFYHVIDNQTVDALRIGESVTDVFTYTVVDGHGVTSTSTMSFVVNGRNDAPNALAVIPNFAINSTGGSLAEFFGPDHRPVDGVITHLQKPGFAFDFTAQLGITGQSQLPVSGQPYLDYTQVDATYSGALADFIGGRITKDVLNNAVEEVIDDIQIVDGRLRIFSHSYDPNEIAVEENLATGTLLAFLQGYDPDHDAAFTYAFSGLPSAASRFEIVNGNELRVKDGALLDFEGSNEWTVTLSVFDEYYDGGFFVPSDYTSAEHTFTIRLLDVNEAPTAMADANAGDAVVEAGGATAGNATAAGNVVYNDTDPDSPSTEQRIVQGVVAGTASGPLTNSLAAPVEGSYGQLVINADGSYTYTLDNARPATEALADGQAATDVFSYTMHDKGGLTSTATLAISITGANDAPVATDSVARTNQGTPIEGRLTARDVDAGDVLTFSTDLDPAHGTVSIDMDGHFTFTPSAGFSGSDSFTFTVHDGHGGVDSGRVDITVDAQGRQNITYLYSGADVQNEAWGGTQAQPDVVALPNGGHLVVWSVANAAVSGTTAGGAYEIWGQRWTADGERDGASFRLNEPRNTNQQWASVDVFSDGSFVAVWESAGQDGGGTSNGIVGRRFNADGTPSTGEFIVNTITAFNEEQPTVRTLPDGGFIVTWTGITQTANFSQDVYARVYGPGFDSGTGLPVPLTGGVIVNVATAANAQQIAHGQLGENVLVLDATHVVVLFADNSGGGSDVRARIIDPTSAATIAASPPDFRVNTTLIGDQQIASAAKLADGDFVVVWQQTRTDGLYIPTRTDIYLQRFNADGSFDGVETKVNTFDRFEQTTPRVAATPDGGFGIIWQSQTVDGSSNNKLAYQKFDALGLKTGSEMIVDADNRFEGMQTPDLIAREDGALVVVWADQGSFGYGGGNRWIGQQVIDEAGDVKPIENTEPDELVSNVSSPNNLRRPDVVALADGGHLVVWNNTNGDSEGGVITARGVWAQRYDADGTKVAASGSGAGGPFMVSTIYPGVSPGRDHTATAALDDGGFVVVWSSYSQTGNGTWDIWGRKFDASGVATGGEFIVTHVVGAPGTVLAGNQQIPSVLGLAGGGFVVSWDNPDASGFNDNVVFKVYSNAVSGGAPVELTGDIVASTAVAQTITQEGDLTQPIARLDDGRFVLTWTAPDSTQTGIYARIVNADGTFASGAEFRVNTTTNGFERTASAGALDDGGFVVTWTGRLANGQETVMIQRYDATGSAIGVETVVPSYDFNHGTHYAKVEGLHDGGWVVIWQSYGTHGLNNAVDGSYSAGQNDGIAGQRYDQSGNKVGSQFLVSLDSYGAEQKPSFDVRADGAMVITWLDASGRRVEQLVVDQPDDVTYTSDMGLPTVINAGGQSPTWAYPRTIALQDGGHLTAWFEYVTAGSNAHIHAQRYDASGQAVGAEFDYAAGASNFFGGLAGPGVAQLTDGSIVFTWLYFGTGSSQYVLQGRLFDQDLNPLGTGNFRAEDATLTVSSGTYSYVEALADGNFVVSWSSHAGLTQQDVAARVFDGAINPSTGQPDAVTSGFLVNTTLALVQEQRGAFSGVTPIAALEGGRFVAVWSDTSAGTSANSSDVKARLFEADGTPVSVDGSTAEFFVNATVPGMQRYTSVDALQGGGFVVSWLSSSNATNSQSPVVAQRFDVDGNKVGGEILVNLFNTGSVSDTRVEGLADGGFVVVWASNTTTSFGSIAGQRFDADGEKVDGMFQISETTAVEHLYGPSFDVRTDGTLAVTWNNNNGKIETKIVDFGEVQPKNFTGTDGNDSFIGSRYADDITGGAGNDLLTGGGGRDAFRFNFPTDGVDTITDFAHNIDHLAVSAAGFGGGLVADQLATLNLATGADMAGFTFASSDGWFFFDQAGAGQGDLYWDADGGGSENALVIAKLQNVTVLTANDFHIVS